MKTRTENTHHRGSVTVRLTSLCDSFGFEQTSKTVSNSTLAKQLNPNKINRRSALKLAFSGSYLPNGHTNLVFVLQELSL